jgi:catechol 2,3-dioxygenase-like lactoylglutathione lyase family enzyme
MKMRYAHTNLIARDWRRLAAFYEEVFGCTPVPPERRQSGEWLERGTGVAGARLEGVHLKLPGHGEQGPTLEIYSYSEPADRPPPVANRLGFGHIAFEVRDVGATLDRVCERGGSAVGEVVTAEVSGRGRITFVYAADPEGNLIELQCWDL